MPKAQCRWKLKFPQKLLPGRGHAHLVGSKEEGWFEKAHLVPWVWGNPGQSWGGEVNTELTEREGMENGRLCPG